MLFTKLLFDQSLKAKKTSVLLQFLSRRTFTHSIHTLRSRQSGSLGEQKSILEVSVLLLPLTKSACSLGFSVSTLKMLTWSLQVLPSLLVILVLEHRQGSWRTMEKVP